MRSSLDVEEPITANLGNFFMMLAILNLAAQAQEARPFEQAWVDGEVPMARWPVVTGLCFWLGLWTGSQAWAAKQIAPSVSDLPLVEIAGSRADQTLVLFLSGDGGWRDLDKTIAERLAAEGLQVVGFDCLRYFWTARSPAELAEALGQTMDYYRRSWGSQRFVLAGYSFGADVLPAAVSRLPAELRSDVIKVVLLGLSDQAEWVIHPAEWIGIRAAGDPVLPDAAKLDMRRVLCISGREEEVSLCRDPALSQAERIETSGGHHFDGDYQGLALKILASIRRSAGP